MDELNDEIYILNALDKNVHAVAFGNHFNLKPRQVKRFRHEIGAFLDKEKGYLGLIAVSSAFEDPAYATTDEGKAELVQKIEEGVMRRCQYLQTIVNNLQVSLPRDLSVANIKADVSAFASDGELAAIDELLEHQRHQQDQAKVKAERARVGLRRLQAAQNATVNMQPKKEE